MTDRRSRGSQARGSQRAPGAGPRSRRCARGGALAALLLLAGCGEADRCADRGGRWNGAAGACEFVPGPLDTPALAIEAGRETLVFAYGREVLDQEPFFAELSEGVWHVYGTQPKGTFGRPAHAWIHLEDGHVERLVAGD